MDVGDEVEVHIRFTGEWGSGFQIAQILPDGYQVRRKSDGSLLPGHTAEPDLRPISGTGHGGTP